jgi:hypothetical protein
MTALNDNLADSELRRLRRFLDLSVQDVSSATGVPMNLLWAAERGRRVLNRQEQSLVVSYLSARLGMTQGFSGVARCLGPCLLANCENKD